MRGSGSCRTCFCILRQVSGRAPISVDLNALVEQSLSLCYHGARAEKRRHQYHPWSVPLTRPPAEVNLLPQEITRVLPNLISNSFYATAQRKAEANGGNYEPILTATTKNLGDSVVDQDPRQRTACAPEAK